MTYSYGGSSGRRRRGGVPYCTPTQRALADAVDADGGGSAEVYADRYLKCSLE
jgi:hypothetical protein